MREASTPIRQQYLRIKRRYPQAIDLFRLGDFYETFYEDESRFLKKGDYYVSSNFETAQN